MTKLKFKTFNGLIAIQPLTQYEIMLYDIVVVFFNFSVLLVNLISICDALCDGGNLIY